MASEDFRQFVEQLGDKDRFVAAWEALDRAGNAALGAVCDGLSHPDWRVRRSCASFMDHHWDEPSLRRLVLTLTDPKLKVRKAAVHSLGCDRCKGGENPIDAVPLLVQRLADDKSIKVRRTAAWTLAIQKPEKRIARILRKALRDETDPKLCLAAKWGIMRYEQAVQAAAAPPAALSS
jgi:HEAT repeat protein